ncbi:hypothetical protein SAMN06296241_1392 [Salinimicrobium sediminis]|uniref:Uncharacterized protein n=1 Tax=Salinimicrobium sediminis TaxID=1343891 RepID=A0A285X506_9FLAO|nr:hypothetical protein [Salinimicrobium sediminis]SOC79854.1 hypothetical protein SAMN06296241_1392 [Salinimicrobium sediminis]
MTAEATYQFLKPSLEQLTQEEKDALCRLIKGEPNEAAPIKRDTGRSVEWYKKQLLKTVFKSQEY